MRVIGLCGGSGSGKGTAASLFMEHGIPSIDTDALYHEMTAGKNALTDALADRFGDEILKENGALDRARLSEIVFRKGAETALADLNRISHYHILNAVRVWLSEKEKEGCAAALVDAPLLFESGFDKECDGVICVIAPKEARIERILKRDGITREKAERRIAAQASDAYLLARSGYHIYNDGDLAALSAQVATVAKKILK
ncbi:MAG: dephospho-CoA kinase [Clostridia bacterium]|nr:dephospho-CoA kinase [Clostridia bacterium]